jgi:hypothetical protein
MQFPNSPSRMSNPRSRQAESKLFWRQYEKVDPTVHLIEKMSPALSTRMNSFNFILNERGGVLARRVAAGVGLTRSDGQVVKREQGSRAAGIREYSRHLRDQFSIDDNTILTNRGAVSVDKEPSAGMALESSTDQANMIMNDWIQRKSRNFLWLPHEYRSARLAFCDGMFAFGLHSGQVRFIQLDRY